MQPDVMTSTSHDSKSSVSTHFVRHKLRTVKVTHLGGIYCDVIGASTVAAQSGALYHHIYYSEDWDFIHAETTKSCSAQDLPAAAQQVYKNSKSETEAAKLFIMCPSEMCMRSWGATTDIQPETKNKQTPEELYSLSSTVSIQSLTTKKIKSRGQDTINTIAFAVDKEVIYMLAAVLQVIMKGW